MRASQIIRYALGICTVAPIFAGCGAQSRSALVLSPPIVQQNAAAAISRMTHPPINGLVENVSPRRSQDMRSWINPGVASGKLLYVSDPPNGDVYIYAWDVPGHPRGFFMGRITGLSAPNGMCTDKADNIWVTQFSGPKSSGAGLIEFAHNRRIGSLPDPKNEPESCSVDETTGNIAVTNYRTTTGEAGSVYIYPHGSSHWKAYHKIGSPPMNFLWYLGYDNMGNLFVDGSVTGAAGDFRLAELPKSGSFFRILNWAGRLPGQIQWDAGRLNVGDQQASPKNSPGTCIGEPTRGCGASYTQHFDTNFIDTLVAEQTFTSGTRFAVPNPTGVGCVTPLPPATTCTQIYYYGLGVSPIREIDEPNYQVEPWGSVITR